MPQPPPTHITARVEVVRLLLTSFCGRATEQRSEPAFASQEAEHEIEGNVIIGNYGSVLQLEAGVDEALKVGGDLGGFVDPVLDLVTINVAGRKI